MPQINVMTGHITSDGQLVIEDGASMSTLTSSAMPGEHEEPTLELGYQPAIEEEYITIPVYDNLIEQDNESSVFLPGFEEFNLENEDALVLPGLEDEDSMEQGEETEEGEEVGGGGMEQSEDDGEER